MIEEAYVSFETAKLLKEKGFDNECSGYYDQERVLQRLSACSIKDTLRSPFYFDCIPAPTQQMAMRWLREVHDIKIMIRPYVDGTYSYEILNGFWYVNFDSYEDATEAAIKCCLENLIR